MPVFYDLHLHSCLSPCGDMDMTPCNIVGMAALKHLDIVALTDHNSCKNCPAFLRAAKGYSLKAVAGMELCTSEEIHVVCLFNTLEKAMRFDEYVSGKIPPIQNNAGIFGRQVIMDGQDREIGEENRLLITAADISVTDVTELMEQFGGFCFPAHIDRSSYSILSSLGSIPPECGFSCYELADIKRQKNLLTLHPALKEMEMLKNSDAHYLADISEPEQALREGKLLQYLTES